MQLQDYPYISHLKVFRDGISTACAAYNGRGGPVFPRSCPAT
jgi:hypothetical protein